MKVLCILASGHSGTTLLDMMLGSHSAIAAVGELATINTVNQEAKQDPFWGRVCASLPDIDLEPAQSKLKTLFGSNAFFGASTKEPLDIGMYVSVHEKLYAQILTESGKRCISDSSKDPDRTLLLARSNVIEPIIVHLVRDGRGVTWSYLRKLTNHRFFSLGKWGLENLKIELVRRRLPHVPYLRVRYEDLVQNPEKVLSAILALVDETYEPGMRSFRATPYRGVGGNRMKAATGTELREDVSWKKDMPLYARALFFLTFGWLNWQYRQGSNRTS